MTTRISDLQAGDILIRINTGDLISKAIGAGSGSSSVHGGLAVGQGAVIEVNGGLGRDAINKGRTLANLYLSPLDSADFKCNKYGAWRCKDAVPAEAVAMQAYPFVAQGTIRTPGCNLANAVSSLGFSGATIDETTPLLQGYIRKPFRYASVVAAAIAKKKRFHCTEWVVYIYNKTAALLNNSDKTSPKYERYPIPMKSKLPNPKELAEIQSDPDSFFDRLDDLHIL